MKKTIIRLTGSALAIALILFSSGCTSKRGNESNDEQEAIPVMSQDSEDNSSSGGWSYDYLSQCEEEIAVPGEGDTVIKDKFKDNLKGGGIYLGDVQGEEIPFEAKVIKTASYTTGKEFPTIGLFTSAKDLGAIDTINYDSKYNEEFFNSKSLIVIQLRATSGSIRHEVTKVVMNQDVITVQITTTKPEFGTMDMAEWAIFVEIDNSVVNDNTTVDFVIR